tara:strand:- start:683 stop:1201 length:519 start_codon:yes stop_codon:yes gene_type:complete
MEMTNADYFYETERKKAEEIRIKQRNYEKALKEPEQHYVARDLLEVKEEIGKLIDEQLQNIIDQSNYIAKKNLGLIRYKGSYYCHGASFPTNMTYDEAIEFYHKHKCRTDLVIMPVNDERGVEGPLYADGNSYHGYINRIDPEKEIACPRHYPRKAVEQLIKQLKEQQKEEL